jgi:hypothetical protein
MSNASAANSGKFIWMMALVCFIAFKSGEAVWTPERALLKLGRPTTAKHVNAMRLIGTMGLVLCADAIFQLFRQL